MDQDELRSPSDPQELDTLVKDASGLGPVAGDAPGLGTGTTANASLDDITAMDSQSVGTTGAMGGLSGVGSMGSTDLDSAQTLGGSTLNSDGQTMGDATTSGMNSSSAGGSSAGG